MVEIVGILEEDGRNGRVVPDGKIAATGPVTIFPENLNGAPFGMKVIVELLGSPDSPQPLGRVKKVLGDPARPDVAMAAIVEMYGLAETFPEDVVAELDDIADDLSADEIEHELKLGRRDLRNLTTITIDGTDAKDLDDAVSIQKNADGGYKLYVHIADVTHYVKAGSAIDKEALKRGNSVYLADRVLPMLPAKLSNGICILNPHKPRLSLTCSLNYDSSGSLIDGDIFESLISSDLRGDYESIRKSLEGDVVAGYEKFMPELHWMQELAELLKQKSVQRGALEFDFPETKVEMDKNGNVLDIHAEETSFTNEIIEQFMIAANTFVAKQFRTLELPFIYRVHDYPDAEKLQRFKTVLQLVANKKVSVPANPSPRDVSQILNDVRGLPGEKTLETMLLRSLAKASYSEQATGHFGLALTDYAHFTAPIRRYSDIFIHRVIKGFLRKNLEIEKWRESAPEVAQHVSETERIAILAERTSVDQKVAEYYAKHLGEVYEAEITGFVGAGMFVMLPSTAEGMIPFRTMNDFYVYDELTMTAQGRDSKRLFMMGDKVRVQIARADVVRRQVDLELIDENSSGRIDKEFAQRRAKRKQENIKNSKKAANANKNNKKNKKRKYNKGKHKNKYKKNRKG